MIIPEPATVPSHPGSRKFAVTKFQPYHHVVGPAKYIEYLDIHGKYNRTVIFNTQPTAKQPLTATSPCLDIFCSVHCFSLPEWRQRSS